MAKRVVHVISNIDKSLAFEWIAEGLKKDYALTFILLNPKGSAFEDYLRINRVTVVRIPYRGKADFIIAFGRLLAFFLFKRPHIVHAHLIDAQLLGLTAAWMARIPMRIYTRHNSTFHHDYFPKGVKYDKWSNRMATHIISISQATYKTLTTFERVKPVKIRHLPHGFDLSLFKLHDQSEITALKVKYQIPDTFPIIGVVARHIEWKGIQYTITAFSKILADYPSAILILANAYGPYHNTLLQQLAVLPKRSYILIPFEAAINSLYKLFDVYVHVPVDALCEAFGQTYVEALASGVPSIFTKSGIAAEFIVHKKNAWVVDFKNADQIYEAMCALLSHQSLRASMAHDGEASVAGFNLPLFIQNLKQVYEE